MDDCFQSRRVNDQLSRRRGRSKASNVGSVGFTKQPDMAGKCVLPPRFSGGHRAVFTQTLRSINPQYCDWLIKLVVNDDLGVPAGTSRALNGEKQLRSGRFRIGLHASQLSGVHIDAELSVRPNEKLQSPLFGEFQRFNR